jgi:hypothetical protein
MWWLTVDHRDCHAALSRIPPRFVSQAEDPSTVSNLRSHRFLASRKKGTTRLPALGDHVGPADGRVILESLRVEPPGLITKKRQLDLRQRCHAILVPSGE